VTQTTLNGYGTDIGVARTSINTAISSLTVAETAWLSAATALASAEKNLSLKKAGATAQDLAAQQARVKSAKASVLDAEAQLRKTRIIAPFAGTITEVSVKVGEVAQSNTPVISIITASDLLVESYVPETNVALLAVDDTAEITLDAYGGDAVFAARVASIDPAETVRDGISTYRTLLTFEQADARIRPGMTANISIVADKRDNVISVPQKIITIREGKKLVKVKRGDIFEDREVTTGAVSSVGTIEILSGLSVGDVVLLSEKK
jgi:RND family efflux transporter MFP subunit